MMLPPVPVSGIVVFQPDGDLVESTSSVRLSCSSNGSSLSFLWLNGSSEVAVSDRVHVTDGASALVIVSVTRLDQGPFRCQVFNPVSNGTSDPVSLTINCELVTCIFAIFMLQCKRTFPFDIFIQMVQRIPLSNPSNASFCPVDGPEKIKIAGPAQIQVGQSLTLNCSADSIPPASYKWTLEETELSNSSELSFVVQSSSGSGNYTCHTVNSVTGRTSSVVHAVLVTEKSKSLL